MKVKMVKEVKRSDGLWRFACGDVYVYVIRAKPRFDVRKRRTIIVHLEDVELCTKKTEKGWGHLPRSQWQLSEANSVHSQSSPWRPIFLESSLKLQKVLGSNVSSMLICVRPITAQDKIVAKSVQKNKLRCDRSIHKVEGGVQYSQKAEETRKQFSMRFVGLKRRFENPYNKKYNKLYVTKKSTS